MLQQTADKKVAYSMVAKLWGRQMPALRDSGALPL
jgi:hypothetical protein